MRIESGFEAAVLFVFMWAACIGAHLFGNPLALFMATTATLVIMMFVLLVFGFCWASKLLERR